MAKNAEKEAGREQFLQLVLEKKDQLFGKFSSTLTNDKKKELWDDIRKTLVNAGVVQYANKSAEDLRKSFADMKRRTLDRKKASEGTGKGRVFLNKVKFRSIILFKIIE